MSREREYVLAPCPFCGGAATMDARDSISAPHNYYHISFVEVCCANEECPAQPSVDLQERDGLEETKSMAVEAWNRRASRPTAPAGEPVAWLHPHGAIWHRDNCPADIDFTKDGGTALFPEPPDTAAIREQVRPPEPDTPIGKLARKYLDLSDVVYADYPHIQEMLEAAIAEAIEKAAQAAWRASRYVNYIPDDIAAEVRALAGTKRPAPPASEGGQEP